MLPFEIIFLQYVHAEADKGNRTKLPIPVSKRDNDEREILSSGGMKDLAAKLVSIYRCILYRHNLVIGKVWGFVSLFFVCKDLWKYIWPPYLPEYFSSQTSLSSHPSFFSWIQKSKSYVFVVGFLYKSSSWWIKIYIIHLGSRWWWAFCSAVHDEQLYSQRWATKCCISMVSGLDLIKGWLRDEDKNNVIQRPNNPNPKSMCSGKY